MNEKELVRLGENVRKQGYGTRTAAPVVDLVFNPETGEFEQCAHGSTPAAGTVVTAMTREGFAAHA